MTRRTSIKLMAGAIASAVLPLPTVARSLEGAGLVEDCITRRFSAVFFHPGFCTPTNPGGFDIEVVEITREEFNAEVERRAQEARRRPLGMMV